jgi:predicted component of type VI protein secretion system
MSVLRTLEAKIAGLVEGTFARAFKSEVRPVEIARKLAKEMDDNKLASLSRTYAPNEYVVWLSQEDREHFGSYEADLRDELAGYLLEHARGEGMSLLTRPQIEFRTDERLRLGEFGIQTRMVRPGEGEAEPARQGDHGHTMVYSTSDRLREELDRPRQPDSVPATRAMVLAEGKRMVIPASGAVIGRSRDADIVLSDPNVSRRHAEIRPAGRGRWTVNDMGSTNGVKVNGTLISGDHPLRAGDRIALGTADMRFVVE